MTFEFRLPDIGEGVVEGEIVKWLVRAGDAVEVDQPLVEVMTDKATVVIPSPRRGRVRETRGSEGDVAAVGAVLVVLDDEAAGAPHEAAARGAPLEAAAGPRPAAEAASPTLGPPPALARAVPPPHTAREAASPSDDRSASPPSDDRVRALAAPATRRLARELGVELDTVVGTGPAGRVTSEDVRRASERRALPTSDDLGLARGQRARPAPEDAPTPAPGPSVREAEAADEVVPVRGVRRRIWDAMTRSAFTAPHFTFVEECDVTELVGYRERLNAHIGAADPRLTFLPFIVKAVTVALGDFPDLNGQVDDAQRAFVRRTAKHVGVAVAAEQGLTVPVVRHADRRSLIGLAREIRRLGDAVRAGTIAASDLGGSTFTITSLGKDGGLFATPILNYPEVAILGVHRLQKRPVVRDDDRVEVRSMMNLSLSCDHRWVDGHVAARFTYRVIELLEQPDRLVLEMG